MTKTNEQWCLCGCASEDEPWELIQDGFDSREEAEEYLKIHHATPTVGDCRHFYVDRENNEIGPAECYFETEDDGSLTRVTDGGLRSYFAS